MKQKIILYIAESLDGFIARENGSVDWLAPYENGEEDYGYNEFYNSVGTVILGNTTYQQFPNSYKDKACFVFSKTVTGKQGNVTFINENVEQFIEQLNPEGNKNIWLVGGADLVEEFLKYNLIDEFIITTIPVLLGKGIPLFKGNGDESQLKLVNAKTYDSGIVQVYYKKSA